MRDGARTLSDFRTETLSIECEPCGRRGRYNVARLMEKYGDVKLRSFVLANCPKAKSQSIHEALPGQVRQRQPAGAGGDAGAGETRETELAAARAANAVSPRPKDHASSVGPLCRAVKQ